MNFTQRDTQPAPDAIWSTALNQPPAGPLLVVGDLLLVPTHEPGPPSQHSALHALSLVDGSPRWQHPFEHALVSGLASAHTPTPPPSPTPTLPHFPTPTPTLILVATTSTDLLRGEGALVALDAAGEEQYRWAPGVQRVSAPVISSEIRSDDFSRPDTSATEVATTNSIRDVGGVACVTADARMLVVLDIATGAERARVRLEASASLSAPALVGNVAYVPCRGPHLLAVGIPPCFREAGGGLASPPGGGGLGGVGGSAPKRLPTPGWTRPPS